MSNQIVRALEHGAQKLEKTLVQDAGAAVKDFYHSAGNNLKKVAENTAEADAKHAAEFKKIIEGGEKDLPHDPRAVGVGSRSGGRSGKGDQSLGGPSKPGQFSEGNRKCTKAGDPVDVVSGQMITSAVDLELPGLLPLVVQRSYASAYQGGQWFGPGWSSTLDQRVQIDDQGIHYAGDDAQILHYPRPGQPGLPVLPTDGARWPLTWDQDTDTIRIEDTETGWIRHFDATAVAGAARPICLLTDRNGHRIEYLHDDVGLPTEIRHTGGYRVAVDIIHTAAGPRVEALRLLDGTNQSLGTTVLGYGYDARGRLAEITNSTGTPLVYGHDAADRLTSWTDRNDYWYQYEYGPDGRVSRGHGSNGVLEAAFEYDDDNRVTTVINSLGHRTQHHYDQHGHITRTVDPAGHTVHTEHDRHGNLLSRTDELGHTTRYTLDDQGDIVRIDRADGTTMSVYYNGLRLPVRVIAADGAVWRYAYDERGNLITTTDPLGAVTRYSYDQRGHRTSRTDALGHTISCQTDGAGLEIEATAALGNTVRVRRDAFGRVVAVVDPVGGTVRQGWTIEGSPAWRVTADGAREEWDYDLEGNLRTHRNPAGQTTAFEYGPFDLPSLRIDPDGSRYAFTHDSELRLVEVTNPNGLTWRYELDETGCLIGETDFNGRTLRYRSDAAGRLIERSNGAGQTVSLIRDALGRVTANSTGDGATTTFAFDAAGRLLRAAAPGCVLEYTRDAVGRVTGESVDGQQLTSEYDLLGQRVRRVTPTGAVSVWTYDPNGLPATLATIGGGLSFQYDLAGRETTRTFGEGAVLTQSWNSAHRLVGQAIWAKDAAEPGTGYRRLQSRSYTYRADGHPTEIADQLSGTRRFDLDQVGRVTAVHAATWTETYAYDMLGNLAHAAYPSADDDAQGAREHTGTLIRRAGRTRYEHDGQGRVVRSVRRTISGQEKESRYSWDAEDRLVEALTPEGTVWRYQYDALGRRTAKIRLTQDGAVAERTLFSWDETTLAEQRTVLPGIRKSITWDWDPGTYRAAAQLDRAWRTDGDQAEIDRRFHAIVTDLTGTPTELVGLDGRIAWRGVSTLWGRPIEAADSQTPTCPLRFPGQYHDVETGLDYNLARYYDADTARYVSPDPLGLRAAPNHHGYVDNPLWWIDPLGLKGKKIKRTYDDSEYNKHGTGSNSSGKGEVSRAPKNGQAALDRSIDLDPSNPNVTRRLGVDHGNNEIVVLDRHRAVADKDGNVIEEIYHGHVQSKYPSPSVTQGDLTQLKRAGMIDNIKKQRVLPPPCEE
ncbi:DUF6531 domain-containing protein [Kitasatospora sp. MAP5-34]|uniref:DUF6531 domain-containing protein n=1 Tax=Kitasatospora sp. MAP5-34 TaxID=3035102 RepID=UPI002476F015|nr:DUF6531 domain-containing protein [Kitasatospora sp. MAP5-34]MDH6580654.1 RHS repeat-associated protein [Kitasatospora sp. MAP5-34]